MDIGYLTVHLTAKWLSRPVHVLRENAISSIETQQLENFCARRQATLKFHYFDFLRSCYTNCDSQFIATNPPVVMPSPQQSEVMSLSITQRTQRNVPSTSPCRRSLAVYLEEESGGLSLHALESNADECVSSHESNINMQ